MRIDINELVEHLAPKLKKIPFLIPYLRKVIHQDELNHYLESYSHLDSIGFIRGTLSDMGVGYSQHGMEKLDPKGRYIFASNHPFGGLDGVMLADEVSTHFGDVRVVVNDLLMRVTPLAPIFIPINKHGSQNAEYHKMYNDAFESNIPLITFPAGLVSRRRKGVVTDSQWKTSFVRQAISNKRDVVPVYFDGAVSNFFYRLSNIRTKLGVKLNIERIYLVDEMHKQKGRNFDIIIGEPLLWQELAEMSPVKATQLVREKAYSLKK